MIKNRKQVLIVAAVMMVAVTGAAGFTAVADTTPDAQSGFCADMPDAVGLYEGNAITQMGYQVGQVDQIQPKGDHVEVTFSLDAGRQYPADVKAVTRSKSLLADRSVELVGNYQTGPQLTAGKCISLDDAYTPKSISEIAGSAADFIDALAPADGEDSLQTAVAGFDDALRGNDDSARALMLHASQAMSSPDQLVADIDSIVMNGAPLTEETLQRWATIRSILAQLPTVVTSGTELTPAVAQVATGIGWLGATLYDIQTNYGDDIWPFMNGQVANVIHLAASRSKDIQSLLSTVPSVAGLLRQQSASEDGLTMAYQPPTVEISPAAAPQLCELVSPAPAGGCTPDEGHVQVPIEQLLGLVLAKGK